MQHPRVKFPYGISNIEKLVEQNYVFVYKTKYVELLELDESYSIFLRPRRMGKSLFVSILEYYYDILEQDKFEKIFSKLYIGQNPTKGANAYRVLKMDLSGIDSQTEEDTFKFFLKRICIIMKSFMERYDMFSSDKILEVTTAATPGDVMATFFQTQKPGKKKLETTFQSISSLMSMTTLPMKFLSAI